MLKGKALAPEPAHKSRPVTVTRISRRDHDHDQHLPPARVVTRHPRCLSPFSFLTSITTRKKVRIASLDALQVADDVSERIRDFLSTFEQDVADGLAEIDLHDGDDMPARTKSLKYMKQLVRRQHPHECMRSNPSHSKGWRTGSRRCWWLTWRTSRRCAKVFDLLPLVR